MCVAGLPGGKTGGACQPPALPIAASDPLPARLSI
jgi:hypothetical protein